MKNAYQNMPIYRKAEEIQETVTAIVNLFPEDNEMLQSIKPHLLSDAHLIVVKLVGAMSTKLMC